jgi:hypothetical protein
MWIRFEHQADFMAQLRDFVGGALKSRDYYRQPGKLHNRLARWVIEKYGDSGYLYLRDWALHIMIESGPDRSAETVWSSLVQRLGQAGSKENDWISQRMSAVRQALNERDDAVEAILRSQGTLSLSGWDREVLSIHYSSVEAVDRKITLICSYNNLLLSWSQFCRDLTEDELSELDRRGRVVAPDLGWRDQDVPFPGNWMFDLGSLIRAAEKEEVTPLMRT